MAIRNFRYIGQSAITLDNALVVQPNAFTGPIDDSLPLAATAILQGKLLYEAPAPTGAPVYVPVPAPIDGATSTFGDVLSNATDTYVETEYYYNAIADLSSLAFLFTNFRIGANGEVVTAGNPLQPVASIEYPTGVFTALYFNGARKPVIDINGFVWSDPVDIFIPKGAQFGVITYLGVTAGQTWPLSGAAPVGALAEGGAGAGVDKTLAGGVTNGAYGVPYGPSGVRSRFTPNDALSIAGFGDSNLGGFGDTGGLGWFKRAFAAYRNIRMGQQSETAYSLQDGAYARRLSAASGFNASVIAHGINDLQAGQTALQVETNLIKGARARAQRGPVYVATLMPNNTSTDNWQTLGNQTPKAGEASRVAINQWIRDGMPINSTTFVPVAVGNNAATTIRTGAAGHPVKRTWDVCSVVESAQDSGKWKVTGAANYATPDGLHPSLLMHTNIAAFIPVAQVLADTATVR
jgi:hypothetical protein